MTVRFHDLSVPHWSIAQALNISDDTVTNYPNLRIGCLSGDVLVLHPDLCPSGSGRQRYSVLGAVKTRDHDFVSIRTAGSINAEVVCQLLEKISATYPGEEITLVMDNARYQRSRLVMEMADALDMEFLYLPAYSPNLNLIERVWRLVKARCLRNKYFPNFTLFTGALDEFLDSLNGKNREHLKTLVTENFQILQNPKF